MKVSLSVFLLLVCLSCSRQPVGVRGNPAPPQPVTPDAGPPPAPNPNTQEAIQNRLPSQKVAPDADTPTRENARFVPDNGRAPAQTELNENQTAQIENQGNVGNVPITSGDRPGTPMDAAADEAEPLLMTYRRSNCYGDCEAYTFDLRSGGLTSLMVDQGEIARGLYNRQLYSVDYDNLNNSIDSLSGLDLAPVYPVDEEIPTDIPFRSITLPGSDGRMREVKVYGGAPPALQRFIDRLELLIDEQSWERVRDTEAIDRN